MLLVLAIITSSLKTTPFLILFSAAFASASIFVGIIMYSKHKKEVPRKVPIKQNPKKFHVGQQPSRSGQLPVDNKYPLVYSTDYNIDTAPVPSALLAAIHPFDARKWGNVYNMLLARGLLSEGSCYTPKEADHELLRTVHSEEYLQSLRSMQVLSHALEVPLDNCCFLIALLFAMPEWALLFATSDWANQRLLRPMRLQTGGSVLAAELALNHGWAINIGGGFHHASATQGSGFCVYADISIALRALLNKGRIQRAMIIDLDAHQGNGYERDFLGDERVYIMDMFNEEIFPRDFEAYAAIRKPIPLRSLTGDQEYMAKLEKGIEEALKEFPKFDLLLYNAGTDLLHCDRLGQLSISEQAVIARDQLVFKMASQHRVPIVMLTSGGYSSSSAGVIANSIINLHSQGLITLH